MRLEINFTPGEGALLRMLGLVERRGFRVQGIAMSEVADRGSLAVDLEPRDSGRHLDVIARQLARLVDVQSVAVTSTHSGPSA
ncbi:MAG: acetolactate synthase [Pseudomonadota bacterium]|nr:acetolactate synthase [Pseudomonadota bacterium]